MDTNTDDIDLVEIRETRKKRRETMQKYRKSTSRHQVNVFLDAQTFGEMNMGMDLSRLSRVAFVSKAISLYADQLFQESKKS
jgi:hypothetical protein